METSVFGRETLLPFGNEIDPGEILQEYKIIQMLDCASSKEKSVPFLRVF